MKNSKTLPLSAFLFLFTIFLSCTTAERENIASAVPAIETDAQLNTQFVAGFGTYKKRIGYLWFNPNQITTIIKDIESTNHDLYYKNLTHVILSFVNPLSITGTSIGFSDNGTTISISETKIKTLITSLLKKNPNLRIGIAVGGGGAGTLLSRYTTLLNTTTYRTYFINSLVSFTKNVGAHFIDVDLEYKLLDITKYNAFVQECFTTAKARGINQTLTLEYKYGDNGIVTKVNKVTQATFNSCDLLNIMSYDYNDNYSPLSKRINDKNHSPVKIAQRDIDFFLTKVPADKVVLGIPFYGKSAYSTEPSAEYVDVVVTNINSTTGYYKGTKGEYYFNSKQMLLNKLDYAAQKNICGVMFWSIRSDRMSNYNNSVLKYIVDNQK